MTGDRTSARELFDLQARLQDEAAAVLGDLDLLGLLEPVGVANRVGSLAHGLMVRRDIDVTVVCPRLMIEPVTQIASVLADHARVRSVSFRNDSGHWNTDPSQYPDGLFLGVEYVTERRWELDIWFVDEPDRQPDLSHVKWLADLLTDRHRAAILAIKHAWHERPEYGTSVTSYDIYTAVIDAGVRSADEFEALVRRRQA